ncbi:MAG: hypothetical protein BGO98_06505 [Myxococcales bacterium 68-20]|nr:MAG: hypothetical protein BGO98_06505 [Myxococcales bacterium 68-20]
MTDFRDGLSDFGRGLFEAADEDRPAPQARDALLATVLGSAAVTTSVTAATVSAAVKGGLAAHASAGTGLATKGATLFGAKFLVASALAVTTTAVVVKELRTIDEPPPAIVSTVSSSSRTLPQAPSRAPAIVETVAPSPEELPSSGASAEEALPPRVEPVPFAPAPLPPPAPVKAYVVPVPAGPNDVGRDARDPLEDRALATKGVTAEDELPSSLRPAPASADEAVPPPTASSLGAQIALIDAARADMRSGDARGALAKVRAFELRYGTAASLAPEAMLVRVQAHLAMGNRGLAEATADALLRAHPSSSAARRATNLVGNHD